MTDIETTKKEQGAIARLELALKDFPDTLWLFAAAGSLHVMKCGESGEHVYIGKTGGANADYSVAQILDVDCDGGDW